VNTSDPISIVSPAEQALSRLDLAIDFVNTTGLSKGKPFDELPSAGAAVHWLTHVGLLTPADARTEQARFEGAPDRGETALRRLRQARAGLRELIDAMAEERAPRAAAVADVNAALRVRENIQIVADGPHVGVVTRREGEPFDQALASIARAVADEIGAGRPERFRVCENETCRWAFYDRSRPGTRRWCEMSSCGNRMKAARHRARKRADAAAGTTPPDRA
jgi:predicted RNA-binding Zn ribbon-like protein